MNENKRTGIPIYIIGIILIIAAFGLGFYLSGDEPLLEGVTRGNEYHATNTDAFGSDSTLIQAASTHGTAVTLGSVVVASTTPYWVQIYDATSTAAVTAGIYSTLVGTLESSITEGTYTFDAALQDGLVIVNEAGYEGSYIITFR